MSGTGPAQTARDRPPDRAPDRPPGMDGDDDAELRGQRRQPAAKLDMFARISRDSSATCACGVMCALHLERADAKDVLVRRVAGMPAAAARQPLYYRLPQDPHYVSSADRGE